jgi:cytochrome c oxidase assembly factor CtaG
VADPLALLVVVVTGVAYALGRERWNRRAARSMVATRELALFGAGLVTIAVALVSPIDSAADTSLPAHMVQHVLLLTVAAPLLAFGMPLPTLLWALPTRLRRRSVAFTRKLMRHHDRHFPTWIVLMLVVEALVMLGWHLPVAYEAAIRHPGIHAVEHVSFVLAATAAWWSVSTARRSLRGAAAIAGLFGSIPGMALGAAMVLAPRPWYPIYVRESAADALSNQQLAGVIMWAFGGMAAVVAGAALFAAWLASEPTDASSRIARIPSRAAR